MNSEQLKKLLKPEVFNRLVEMTDAAASSSIEDNAEKD